MIASDRSGRPTWRFWLTAIAVLFLGGYLYLFISAILAPPLPPVVGSNSVVMRTLHVIGQHGPKLGWSFSADSSSTSLDGVFPNAAGQQLIAYAVASAINGTYGFSLPTAPVSNIAIAAAKLCP